MQLTIRDYALLPYYLIQARRVHKHTLRLADPVGERRGMHDIDNAQDKCFRLIIAGDSSAVGVGVASQDDAVSGKLLAKLTHARPALNRIDWQLIAKTGSTSFGVLKQLYALPQTPLDLIIISVGVNDVVQRTPLIHWLENIEHIIALCTRKFHAPILFASIPPMQLMPALPYPLNQFIGRQAGQLDSQLQRICQAHPQANYLRADFQAAGLSPDSLFAKDGFHPSAATYDYWTDVLACAILSSYL